LVFPQRGEVIIMEYFSNFKLASRISLTWDTLCDLFSNSTLSPQLWKVGERVAGKKWATFSNPHSVLTSLLFIIESLRILSGNTSTFENSNQIWLM
jgi:hypothetical protein